MPAAAAGSISGVVFKDTNGNGMREGVPPDSGVAGVIVKLTGTTGSGSPVTATTTTNANGNYMFSALAPGSYMVEFARPETFVFTAANVGGNDAIDSDADSSTGKTASIVVTSGMDITNVDAGVFQREFQAVRGAHACVRMTAHAFGKAGACNIWLPGCCWCLCGVSSGDRVER